MFEEQLYDAKASREEPRQRLNEQLAIHHRDADAKLKAQHDAVYVQMRDAQYSGRSLKGVTPGCMKRQSNSHTTNPTSMKRWGWGGQLKLETMQSVFDEQLRTVANKCKTQKCIADEQLCNAEAQLEAQQVFAMKS